MLSRGALSAEHGALMALAGDLLACVDETAPAMDELTRVRREMTRVLLAHLVKEDALLYPRLKAGSDPRAAAMATRFADEMGDLADRYRTYVSAWPSERIAADWPAFRTETRRMMQALGQRIEREERVLYALLPAEGPSARRRVA